MIAAAQSLHDATGQPATKIEGQAFDGRAVYRDTAILAGLEHCHTGTGSPPLVARPHTICIRQAERNRSRAAQARPLEARIAVGGIIDPADASRAERGGQARTWHRQQRSQETNLRPFDQSRHAGEPVRPACPRRPHRDRLSLVVCVVRDEEVKDAPLPAGVAQQPVAGGARGFLQARLRLVSTPTQDEALDSAVLQHTCRRQRFFRCRRSQAVIDDQREHSAAPRARPFMRQQGEAERISTAGNGDAEFGACLERFERRHQAREGRPVDGSRLDGIAHPQPFFCRSWSIRRFCRSVARG